LTEKHEVLQARSLRLPPHCSVSQRTGGVASNRKSQIPYWHCCPCSCTRTRTAGDSSRRPAPPCMIHDGSLGHGFTYITPRHTRYVRCGWYVCGCVGVYVWVCTCGCAYVCALCWFCVWFGLFFLRYLIQFSLCGIPWFAEGVASLRRLLIHHARTMGARWRRKGGIMACNLIDCAPILAFSFFRIVLPFSGSVCDLGVCAMELTCLPRWKGSQSIVKSSSSNSYRVLRTAHRNLSYL